MGFLTKLERISERYIEGFFKTKFDNHIHPADIAKILVKEMRENKNMSVSAVYVPNEYEVSISEEDWVPLEQVKHALAGELQEFLNQKLQVREYRTVGEFKVSFEVDKKLAPGDIAVKSSFSEALPTTGETDRPLAGGPRESTIVVDRKRFYKDNDGPQNTAARVGIVPAEQPKALLIKKTGQREDQRFNLGERGMLIGRRRTSDICLTDTNVSRIHAAVDCLEGNYFVTDLGSTNGTFVNGQRVSKKKLTNGDIIKIGATILEFRMV